MREATPKSRSIAGRMSSRSARVISSARAGSSSSISPETLSTLSPFSRRTVAKPSRFLTVTISASGTYSPVGVRKSVRSRKSAFSPPSASSTRISAERTPSG